MFNECRYLSHKFRPWKIIFSKILFPYILYQLLAKHYHFDTFIFYLHTLKDSSVNLSNLSDFNLRRTFFENVSNKKLTKRCFSVITWILSKYVPSPWCVVMWGVDSCMRLHLLIFLQVSYQLLRLVLLAAWENVGTSVLSGGVRCLWASPRQITQIFSCKSNSRNSRLWSVRD